MATIQSLRALYSGRLAGCLKGRNTLVVGATAGIGHAIARQLAALGSSVVVVGRNEERGRDTVEKMQAASPVDSEAEFAFHSGDAGLLRDVHRVADLVRGRWEKLDLLVFTQSTASMGGRQETAEGLDLKMSLHYYSRIAFIQELLPLLQRSDDPRVLSVLSAGIHSPYAKWREDPDLRKNFSLKNCADSAGFYNDLGLDALAHKYPSISFQHVSPGFVSSNWGSDLNVVIKGLVRCLQRFARTSEECALFMCAPLVGDRPAPEGGGVYLFGKDAQPVNKTKLHTEETAQEIYKYTLRVIQEVQETGSAAKVGAL
eukprot:Hpha_TRINITY_DN15391_c0_g1::TRINITY_DN15391_c0_g1_i1::g.90865::m.90865